MACKRRRQFPDCGTWWWQAQGGASRRRSTVMVPLPQRLWLSLPRGGGALWGPHGSGSRQAMLRGGGSSAGVLPGGRSSVGGGLRLCKRGGSAPIPQAPPPVRGYLLLLCRRPPDPKWRRWIHLVCWCRAPPPLPSLRGSTTTRIRRGGAHQWRIRRGGALWWWIW